MTELLMLVGIPGCGKSTFAKNHPEYIWHSSDEIREELGLANENRQDNAKCFEVLENRVKKDLENGRSCIYDATNLSRKKRMTFLPWIKKTGCKVIAIVFPVDIQICKERNANRSRVVPEHAIDRMITSFDVPTCSEGFDEIRLFGYEDNQPFDLSIADGFDQDNPHHSLDLGGHLNGAAEFIANLDLPEKRKSLLTEAARYHDIGKLYTKGYLDSHGRKSDRAHFYGHEKYGSYMYLCDSLARCDDAERNLQIALLIGMHMRPYGAWGTSDRALNKDRMILGDDGLLNVRLLHEADKAAH